MILSGLLELFKVDVGSDERCCESFDLQDFSSPIEGTRMLLSKSSCAWFCLYSVGKNMNV